LISKRDVKLLVKLIDLGLARRASDEDFRVTRAGSTVGTVDYMAPEQARDSGKADIRSDLYSLGCTWYHLLAGQPPFAEGGLTERMYKHVETPPVDIRKHNGKVTKRTAQVLHQLLAKDPAERQQTPAELIRQLSQPEKDDAAVDANVLLHLALAEDETLESRSGILMRGGQGTHVRLREERATWFARWCDRFVEQLPWSAVKLTLTAAVLAGLVVLTLRLTRPGAPPPAPRGELKNFSTTRTSA
jgi:serine/threonine protein kinase